MANTRSAAKTKKPARKAPARSTRASREEKPARRPKQAAAKTRTPREKAPRTSRTRASKAVSDAVGNFTITLFAPAGPVVYQAKKYKQEEGDLHILTVDGEHVVLSNTEGYPISFVKNSTKSEDEDEDEEGEDEDEEGEDEEGEDEDEDGEDEDEAPRKKKPAKKSAKKPAKKTRKSSDEDEDEDGEDEEGGDEWDFD